MKSILLPSGNDVGNFIEGTSFNIAGLGICVPLIIKLIDIVRAKFDYNIPIKYVYGSPSILWNGGRIILDHSGKVNIKKYKQEIYKLKEYGIKPLFTFSNINIKNKDLNDSLGNELLELISYSSSEIIVTSELLKNYIQEKYPKIRIHASVIKTSFEKNRSLNYYSQLSKRFSNYVIHPDDNFNFELLRLLPKHNAEIMLNERCSINCDIRAKHYIAISEEQKNLLTLSDFNICNNNFLNFCSFIPEFKQSELIYRNTSLTLAETKAINALGYKLFKIQGRTDNLFVYFFDVMRYIFEPNMCFPHLYPIFSFYIDKFIKESYRG